MLGRKNTEIGHDDRWQPASRAAINVTYLQNIAFMRHEHNCIIYTGIFFFSKRDSERKLVSA